LVLLLKIILHLVADVPNTFFVLNKQMPVLSVRNRTLSPRRFPPPWSVEQQKARFVVRDRAVKTAQIHHTTIRWLMAVS
jgi:hypothetical protein